MTTLRRMTAPEYGAWMAEEIPAYAADKVASGQWSADTALAQSQAEILQMLPDGVATADNHFFAILDAHSAVVGMLWFAVQTKFGSPIAYVFDVSIQSAYQRQGHAQAAFKALETEAALLGLKGIALHVFGHNTAGQALYSKLGFAATNISLYKSLEGAVTAA